MRRLLFSGVASKRLAAARFANSIDSLLHCVGMRFRGLWERRFGSSGSVALEACGRKFLALPERACERLLAEMCEFWMSASSSSTELLLG